MQKVNAVDGSGPQGLNRLSSLHPRTEPEHYWGGVARWGEDIHSVPPPAGAFRHLGQPQPPCRGWKQQQESAAGRFEPRTMAWM